MDLHLELKERGVQVKFSSLVRFVKWSVVRGMGSELSRGLFGQDGGRSVLLVLYFPLSRKRIFRTVKTVEWGLRG